MLAAVAGWWYLFYVPENCFYHIFPALHPPVLWIAQGQMYQDPGRFLAAYSKRIF